MISYRLLSGLLTTATVLSVSCSSKKKSSAPAATGVTLVTEASEETRFAAPVSNGALAITSIDVLGASTSSSTGLRLAGDDSDYAKDPQRIRVSDEAMEGLTQAGAILCFFNQASFVDMVNQGAYLAQADMNTCFNEGGGSSEQGQSSGSTKELVTLTVESSRVDDYSPLVVKAWFSMVDGGSKQKQDMFVKMVITEGQSAANPVGIFRLSWEGGAPGEAMTQHGYIDVKRAADSGKISLNMIDLGGGGDESYNMRVAAELVFDAAADEITSGALITEVPIWEGPEPTIASMSASFDQNYFLRGRDGETQCLAKNDFSYNIWRYGLYDKESGERVTRDSGFPIVFDQDGEKVYGWAGYWGLHLPENVDVVDDMTVSKINHETGEKTDYSVQVGPGKLIKRTKQSMDLAELNGVELEGNNNNGQVVVSYDGSSFKIVGTRGYDGQVQYADGGEFALQSDRGDHASNMLYSRALGGQVIIYSDDNGEPEDTVYYFQEENVTASAGDLTLYCYQQCLRGNISQAQASANPWSQNEESAVFSIDYQNIDWSNPAAAASSMKKTYEFDPDTLTLYLVSGSDRLPVRLADGVDADQIDTWGFQSGAMVTSQLNNPWAAFDQDVYYTWETGPKTWNKFIAIRDADGAAVTFEAPLFLNYVHTEANDRSGGDDFAKYYDKKYLFDYSGFGELHGIPSGMDENGRWANFFNLKDGAEVDGYLVKALDIDMRMKETDEANCSALAVDSSLSLPALDSYSDLSLGDAPTVDGAPAVIEGVIQ